MKRREFIRNTGMASLAMCTGDGFAKSMPQNKDAIIGHGDFRYKIDLNWGALNSTFHPLKDCHEMVMDKRKRIFLLTNHTKNNVLIYNKDGKLLDYWGTEYPGAHGLTIHDENGEEFLYIADNERHEVIKTTLDGKVLQIFPCPMESGKYESIEKYVPTETTIVPNGDIYVADGYGEQYILHYNAKGELLNIFGGKGSKAYHFDNAHGICLDNRTSTPTLLITARQQNKLKRFSLDGQLLNEIELPGAYICRPVIKGQNVYLATIWSGDGSPGTGFVSILNGEDKLVSAPGGCLPHYEENALSPVYQALKVFHHPHDVCVDDDENLYIPQWNTFGTNPIKLIRV
ncbi:6-bladed beta-propeller [Allomuricauda sp. d1]|uniref:6-bladed beta-propeller n=1 Tax=Allomuricauda sp. d1 TaxID=3136725 RepID=UPI0031DE10B0